MNPDTAPTEITPIPAPVDLAKLQQAQQDLLDKIRDWHNEAMTGWETSPHYDYR